MMLAMNPFAPVMDTLVDAMLTDSMRIPSSHATTRLSEDESTYKLTAPLPGLRACDLKITIEGSALTAAQIVHVSGETKTAGRARRAAFSVRVPSDADSSKAMATSIDGVLTITLPKDDSRPEPQIIEVNGTSMDTESDEEADEAEQQAPRYVLTLPAPGVSACDLLVVADDQVLKVSGETRRTGASVRKSARIPRDADPTGASATHVDGVLTISIPKKPVAEPRTLIVNADVLGDAEEPHEEAHEAVACADDSKHEPMEADKPLADGQGDEPAADPTVERSASKAAAKEGEPDDFEMI